MKVLKQEISKLKGIDVPVCKEVDSKLIYFTDTRYEIPF